MNKFTEIVNAWATRFNPDEIDIAKANQRYAICLECEFRKAEIGFVERCGVCHCPLKAKIFTSRTPEEKNCPKGYWDI